MCSSTNFVLIIHSTTSFLSLKELKQPQGERIRLNSYFGRQLKVLESVRV